MQYYFRIETWVDPDERNANHVLIHWYSRVEGKPVLGECDQCNQTNTLKGFRLIGVNPHLLNVLTSMSVVEKRYSEKRPVRLLCADCRPNLMVGLRQV